jgi:hypothetical protein
MNFPQDFRLYTKPFSQPASIADFRTGPRPLIPEGEAPIRFSFSERKGPRESSRDALCKS